MNWFGISQKETKSIRFFTSWYDNINWFRWRVWIEIVNFNLIIWINIKINDFYIFILEIVLNFKMKWLWTVMNGREYIDFFLIVEFKTGVSPHSELIRWMYKYFRKKSCPCILIGHVSQLGSWDGRTMSWISWS